MTEPPEDGWPTLDEPTLLTREPVPPPVAPPPPAPGPPPPDNRIGAGMLLGLGAIGLVAIGLLLALLVTHRGKTTSTTVLVTTSPAGQQTTATTTPAAPARVAVPDLVGGSLADAKTRLRRLGLGMAVTQVTSGRPAGTIVDQAPKPGEKIAKHGRVTLSVARAPETMTTGTTTGATTTATTTPAPTPANATMPDVGGQSEQSAVTALNRAGILASLFFVPSSDPLGTVEQQAKPSGTTLPYHAHVQLNISRGPGEKEDVQVPDVVGRSLTDAVSALNAAKLRLIYVRFPITASSQIGKIVQQSPLAGGKAPANAQVLVFLGVKGS